MLTRRHIRVKVMQSVYAMQQSNHQNLDKEVKFFVQSIENSYHLYLLTMALLKELHQAAKHQVEVSDRKYLHNTKKVSRNFAQNSLLEKISTCDLLQEKINNAQMNSWDFEDEYVKYFYKKIQEDNYFKSYQELQQPDFEQDRKILTHIFRNYIVSDEKFYDYIEDANLTWIDDFPLVNTLIINKLREAKPTSDEKFFVPKLYKSDDDKLFSTDLLKKVLLNDAFLQGFLNEKLLNWDKDRIAVLDTIIIKMGLCEFLKFPTIPVRVTLNEYVEIAKEYSTEKSSIFINGILDSLAKELEQKNEIKKIGRGLL